MSVKPSKLPMPRKLWRQFKQALEANGVSIEERQIVFIDEVGDEYTAFALLYVKEE
jgi:hypothetical protein